MVFSLSAWVVFAGLALPLSLHAEMAPARSGGGAASTGRGVYSSSAAVNQAFASCSDEQKQALAQQGCLEHFERNPQALPHARPCNQSTVNYAVTRALTIIPKCSLGVGKAWIDHGKDLLSFLQGVGGSVSSRVSADAEMREQMRRCNADEDLHTKRQMLTQYSLEGWEADRIRRTSCEDIMSQGRRHERATIRNNAIREAVRESTRPTAERQADFDAAMKRNAEQGREAWNQAYNAIQVWMQEKVGIPLACYNAQKNDELICYGVARIVTPDAVAGTAMIARMRALAGVTRAGEEAAGAATAATRGRVDGVRAMSDESRGAMLARSSSLDNNGRIAQAENLLRDSRPGGLSAEQSDAVVRAHNVGAERGYGAYTRADLDEKARILREAGFNADERQLLMRTGTAGQEAPGATTVSGASIHSGDTAQYINNVPVGVADRGAFANRLSTIDKALEGDHYGKAFKEWQALDRELDGRILHLTDTRTPTGAQQANELRRYQRELRELYQHYGDY